MKKRILSMLMVFMMLVSMLPSMAFAEDGMDTAAVDGAEYSMDASEEGELEGELDETGAVPENEVSLAEEIGSYKVTLPESEAYEVKGSDSVEAGEDYTFTVETDMWYDASAMKVYVNGETVTADASGIYTVADVSTDLVIEVTGLVEFPLLNVTDNVIDITDKTVASWSKYTNKVTDIAIGGAGVVKAKENGTTVDVQLSPDAPENGEITVTFGKSVGMGSMTQSTDKCMLENGCGTMKVTVNSSYVSTLMKGSVEYTINFTTKELTDVPKRKVASDTKETYKKVPAKLNLGEYFTDAETYYIVSSGELVPLAGSEYTVTAESAGEEILVFRAGNRLGMCDASVTVTVNVKEIESGAWLGYETSNGALNHVQFFDEQGNLIDGLTAYYDESTKTVNVELPKDYPVNGKVKSTYNLIQNGGLPFITTSNSATGTSSASSKKFTSNTVTLNSGAAVFTFYLYNVNPKATNNPYTTFKVVYGIKNDLPVLAEGIEAVTNVEIVAGQKYSLDLSGLFTDADDDALTYKVKVNGESAAADVNYEFSTLTAGEYTLEFTANDGKGDSAEKYTVNLKVKNVDEKGKMTVNVPEGLQPEFYAANGFEGEIDVPGDKLEAKALETVSGMTSYEVSFPLNAEFVSVRTDEWGGMAIAAEPNKTVELHQVKLQAENLKGETVDSVTAAAYGEYKAYGIDGKYLLAVGTEYKYEAAPVDSTSYEKNSVTEVLEGGDGVLEISLPLKYRDAKTITAPNGAIVQFYEYNKYYDFTEVETQGGFDNGDGTTTWYFTPAKKSGPQPYGYRVSMEGKITKAGYWEKNLTVTYDEKDASPDTAVSSGSNLSVEDRSVMVNVNGQNNLRMGVGSTYKLKGYRTWEIIKYSYQNEIITPDFHFDIISGQDVIKIEGVKSRSNGGSGEFSDWQNVTALKEGLAIVEVSYDAIQVAGGSWPGIYGATDPARTGLVVVQVGGADTSVKFGINGRASQGSTLYEAKNSVDWDAEFDTLYFTGDYGELELSPTASGAITQVAVSNDKGGSWNTLTDDAGVYTAKITSGNNIIRVTTENGTAYQVVRGDRLSVNIVEKGDGDGLVEAGETARIIMNGLHTPIPKMAGNYNPGYKANNDIPGGDGGVHMRYTMNGTPVKSESVQYTFATDGNSIEVEIPEDYKGQTVTLENGYVGLAVIGPVSFAKGGDSHRNIPDAGCTTRGSETTAHTRSMLPDIEIEIGGAAAENNAPTVKPGAVTEATIEMGQKYAVNPETLFEDIDGNTLTYKVSVDNGEAVAASADYKFEPAEAGEYILVFTADDGKAEVSHSITLTVTPVQGDNAEDELVFDIDKDDIEGYVTVSFEDKGVRVDGEKGLKYPVALGTIIEETKVPYAQGDTIADVTLRLLDAKNIGYENSGTTKSGFYLSAIKNFVVDGVPYDRMAEFDAGSGSGWMITHNGVFIGAGASEFTVKEGDKVVWKYTCQLGADIGDPFYAKDVDDVIALIDGIGKVTLDSAGKVAEARAAYESLDDVQKAKVTNYDKLVEAEKTLAELLAGVQRPSYEEAYKSTGDHLVAATEKTTPVVNSTGGDWIIVGLGRSGRETPAGYYDNVAAYVKEKANDKEQLHASKSTENSRVILALTAAGIDPTDVEGHNLLEGLTDMSYLKKQGINGPIWALIAFDSHDYEIPEGGDVTREALIKEILDAQLEDGGWALAGNKSDADMTGMALQSLAPYYNGEASVAGESAMDRATRSDSNEINVAVERALERLSEMQNTDGTFGSIDGPSAESCAQVIVALTALGVDPATDSRFIKNGLSAVDGLLTFAVDGGGFKHIAGGKLDGMATEQGYYALAAYDRFLDGKTPLFDMSDVELSKGVASGNQGSVDKEDSSDEEKASNSKTKAVKVKLNKKDKETSDNEVMPVQTNPSISDALTTGQAAWLWIVAAAAAVIAFIAAAIIRRRK